MSNNIPTFNQGTPGTPGKSPETGAAENSMAALVSSLGKILELNGITLEIQQGDYKECSALKKAFLRLTRKEGYDIALGEGGHILFTMDRCISLLEDDEIESALFTLGRHCRIKEVGGNASFPVDEAYFSLPGNLKNWTAVMAKILEANLLPFFENAGIKSLKDLLG